MGKSGPRKEGGFTFAELAFAMLILVGGATVLINHISVNYSTTKTEQDRVFAYSKAQAILAEIQGFVDRGQIDAAVDLDVLDDGIVSRSQLTIQTDGGSLVNADHVVSGNYQREGQWVWSRRISVQPFAGLDNRNVRYVTVRVFKRDRAGNENQMADLSAVINSAGSAFPTTQVYDVYLLAVENIPGWWVFMDSIKPFVESMITDLENRNPGLSFRTHWITKSSFGRNPTYRPFINEENDSYEPVSELYHYPGKMPDGSASAYYYVPDNIKGRISLDGVETNGYDSDLNRYPYALADYFNHAMRLPDEQALWETRVAEVERREREILAAEINGTTPPDELSDMSKEPTLRLLLEDLCTDTDKYRNALLINLHGELMPMPALRNFSDAARDPINHPDWRVVTHPEELRTKNDDITDGSTDPLRFRMYAYVSHPDHYYTTVGAPDRMTEPMVVEVMNVNLIDQTDPDLDKLIAAARLACMPGGVDVNGDDSYATSWQSAQHITSAPFPDEEMCYTAEYVAPTGETPFTRIYLFNTPLRATMDSFNRGLAADVRSRLYQTEYIPSPVDAGPSFTTDLSSVGTGPKNTARWTLELAPSVLTSDLFAGAEPSPSGDVQMQVRTRIASNFTSAGETDWQDSGTMFPAMNQPENLSTTYAWWSDSAEDVPMTERAQFNGDPRFVPYKDCFSGGDDFPDSYNWYYDQLNNNSQDARSDFRSINGTYLRNRWNGSLSCDVPRYFEMLRRGLVESACVYTTLTGFSYYYMGIGAEIGYDSANGYPNSIPTNMTPYGGTGNGYINNITGRRLVPLVSDSSRSPQPFWSGMPWLGELYPDQHADLWFGDSAGAVRGNMPAGTTEEHGFQSTANVGYRLGNRLAYGTSVFDNKQITAANGCSTFFNIGTASTRFRHVFASGNGSLTTVGDEIADNYSMTMPLTAPISRPYRLSYGGTGGSHWNYPPYSTDRYTATEFETYYTHGSGVGSGVVKLVNPGGTRAGYIIVNGIDKAVDSGTTFIAKFAVLSLVHSFLEAGDTTNTLRIQQLPRLEIESPTDITELNNPDEIDVLFGVDWTRWDGEAYTATGSYSEDESQLEYVLMYSPDSGRSWRHALDDSLAQPGERPDDSLVILGDRGIGDETYTWSVPAVDFPEGGYLVRIDCYRQGAQVHYAWHQNRIYIQR